MSAPLVRLGVAALVAALPDVKGVQDVGVEVWGVGCVNGWLVIWRMCS